MARLFGTDGVRGIAGKELTCEMAFSLGQAGAAVLASGVSQPSILVGRDPRVSGDMLEAALTAGICSVGAIPVKVGVLPTPAIAYLTRHYQMDAGVVITASHNPVEHNGIKFFDSEGYKLPDALEDEIEEIILGKKEVHLASGIEVHRIRRRYEQAHKDYVSFLQEAASTRLDGLRVVLDSANGAASALAAEVFTSLGAQVFSYYDQPDGRNINEHCGSTHLENLQRLVTRHKAHVGLAFDGDADRMLAVDENGNMVDGDQIMAICAIALKEQGRLKKNTVVATVMSNMGFAIAMQKHGIAVERTAVGDSYVLECMRNKGYCLGGEQSGHIILLDDNTTGDGMLAGIGLLGVMAHTGKPLSVLASVMQVLPQVLEGARVPNGNKEALKHDTVIQQEIAAVEKKFAGKGRVLIRPSGTEPLVRVMIEGEDHAEIAADAKQLKELIEKRLGE